MIITGKTNVLLVLVAALFLLAISGRACAADTTYVRFNTTLGSVDVQLLSDEAPNTVANFLTYVDSNAYRNSFIHRSLSVSTSGLGIFQGGGYYIDNSEIEAILANAPVVNEFNVSNTRGTLAMALAGSDINSATNEWFFNDVDDSASLDPQSFTVFGTVANSSSLAVMDALAAVPVPNPGPLSSPFDQIPLINYVSTQGVTVQNLVYVNSIVRETAPVAATVTLSDLTASYDGLTHGVTVTTNPPGLGVVVTYNANLGAPSAIGSYTVNASITSPGYTGSATGTFAISAAVGKTTAKVTLGNLSAVYDGNPHVATATTTPPGLDVTFTYNGGSTIPMAGGSYAVVATINDPTYAGSATGTLVISKIAATVTLGALAATYDGNSHAATATTSPVGLIVNFTYNGSTTVPTNAGSYTVVGTVDDPDYQGSTTGTLVISKGAATVTLGNLAATYNGTARAATATTVPPGLSVTFTYNGSATAPSALGSYTVVATVSNPNYSGSANGTLVISQGTATVTLTPASLAAIYNGKAHAVTATTVPAGLSVLFTYNSSATAPTAVGSYAVVATVNNANYTGSASGTLIISPVPPLATSTSSTQITSSGATLNGNTNPEGSATTVYFQYGTTTAYGSQTGNQNAGSGTATVTFSANLSGLNAQTIYHYRAVATNGTGGTVNGADKTFTTLAAPSLGTTQAASAFVGGTGVVLSESVNPAGVATSAYFQYGLTTGYGTTTASKALGSGKAAVKVFALLPQLPVNTTYHFQLVTTGPAGTFPGADGTFTTLPFTSAAVVLSGSAATGVTNGTYAKFGNGAINDNEDTAFAATLATSTAAGITTANDAGIWANDNTGTRQLVAQIGNALLPAPETNGATFLTLSDPVYNNNEAVAFRGTLKVVTGLVTTTTATGIWSSSSGALALVARQGSAAPGTGGTFDTFTELGLSDSGGTILLATLNASTAAGVTTANNEGIWQGNTTGDLALMLRLGQVVSGKTISKLTFLPVETYVNGQTRGFGGNTGDLVCGATFSGTPASSGIVTVVGGTPEIAVSSGSSAPGTSATFATFGNPVINNYDHTAFEATLATSTAAGITTTNNAGIWADDNTGTRQLIAQTGNPLKPAPGTSSATYLTLGDPVDNDNEAVAFRATLKVVTGQAATTTATGIWTTSVGGSSNAGALALVARQGSQAPGCPTGATFNAFTELALPNQGGVIFLATLNTNAAADITTTNDEGIWAVDTNNNLQLVTRLGDTINGKTVTAITFLPALSYVNGQSRGFARDTGDLVYALTFSDKSTGIFSVTFP